MGIRAFAAVNAALVVTLAMVVGSTRLLGATTRVPALLPFAFGLAALGAILVAGALDADQRRRFLARHLILYAVVPLGFLIAQLEPASDGRRWAIAYVLLAFSFAVHALVTLWQVAPRLADGRAARILAGVVLTAQAILVPYFALRIMPEADEPHYLIIAQSLAYDGDLDLRNDYEVARYGSFYPGRLRDTHAIEVGPKLYPIRDLGLPVAAALPFRIAGRPGVLVLLAAVTALLVAQICLLLRDLHFTPRLALTATALGALTHPLVTYATQIYPEVFVALAGVSAVRLARRGTAIRPREAALALACLATMPWFTTRAWFYAGGLGLCLLVFAVLAVARSEAGLRGRVLRSFAVAAVPGSALIGMLLAVNWMLFGLAIPGAGFYLVSDQQVVLSGKPLIGAIGLLFGRVFGLLPRSAIYLLAFLGAGVLVARRHTAGPIVAMLGTGWLIHFAFIASLEHWHSDWSPAGRNLVASLPFLIAATAAGLDTLLRARGWHRLLLVPVGGVVGWSALVALLYTAIPAIRYNLPDALRATGATGKLWLLIQETLGGIDIGRALPSTVQPSASLGLLSVIWLGIALALALFGWRESRRWRDLSETL